MRRHDQDFASGRKARADHALRDRGGPEAGDKWTAGDIAVWLAVWLVLAAVVVEWVA